VHPAAIAGDGHEPLRSGRVAHSPQDYLVRAARGEEPPVGGERYCAHAFEIPVLRQQAKIVWPGRVSHIPQVTLVSMPLVARRRPLGENATALTWGCPVRAARCLGR